MGPQTQYIHQISDRFKFPKALVLICPLIPQGMRDVSETNDACIFTGIRIQAENLSVKT